MFNSYRYKARIEQLESAVTFLMAENQIMGQRLDTAINSANINFNDIAAHLIKLGVVPPDAKSKAAPKPKPKRKTRGK